MALGKADLRQFFCVWAVYICCGLLPNVIVIFGFVVDNIEKRKVSWAKCLEDSPLHYTTPSASLGKHC